MHRIRRAIMPIKLPICLAFILCERVTHDPLTGQHTLINLLDDVRVLRVPCVCPSLFVYAELTGSQGQVDLDVRLVRLLGVSATAGASTPGEVVSAWRCGAASLRNPGAIAKIDIRLQEIWLPAGGDYLFILVVNGTPLVSRRFTVVLLRSPS
jgi:hypothetical protein